MVELFKYTSENVLKQFERLLSCTLATEEIPKEWKYTLIHPLAKKGDKQYVNIDKSPLYLSRTRYCQKELSRR